MGKFNYSQQAHQIRDFRTMENKTAVVLCAGGNSLAGHRIA